ncbi:MAG: hypothetical protein F4233_13205 [Rhodospirillaceae bacterium]|nr:hypothetical protein [Rhodospirillaceae bacterium]
MGALTVTSVVLAVNVASMAVTRPAESGWFLLHMLGVANGGVVFGLMREYPVVAGALGFIVAVMLPVGNLAVRL